MRIKFLFFVVLAVVILPFFSAVALEREDLGEIPTTNDFAVGPAKIEVLLEAGATTTKNISITNRLGKAMIFKLEVEDFQGSPTGESPAVLLGSDKGLYSLKDYLKPEVSEFTLEQGERITIPVAIILPEGLEAGGLYGAVLVSTTPIMSDSSSTTSQGVAGQIQPVGKIGVLFFVRVRGEAKEAGQLENFKTADSKSFYQKGSVGFSIDYRNEGNVHLNPYGYILIKNILGKEIEKIVIEPYFVLPGSTRFLEKTWDSHLSFGFYTATLALNRGYNNLIDTKTIQFYFLPWTFIVLIILAILFLILIIWWLVTHLEVRKKI